MEIFGIIGIGFYLFIGILAVIVIGVSVKIYNNLVASKEQIDRAWANIDVILEQRHNEIPKIIKVCETFVQYERETFKLVLAEREKYVSCKNTKDKIDLANNITEHLQGVLALGEAYPELRSSSQFKQLQDRISDLESQISARRELVNEAVTHYNICRKSFPDMILAFIFRFTAMPMYLAPKKKRAEPTIEIKLPGA